MADLEAIRRRWSTSHDRGAEDYTDPGCRMLAEHAFRDVNDLLELVDDLASQRAPLLSDLGRLHGAAMAEADRWKGLGAKVMYVLVHDWPDGLGWPPPFRHLQDALHADREATDG